MMERTMTGESWRYIGLHTLGAAAFIFLLNRFALGVSTEMSLVWAVAFGGGAAWLAYQQTKR